MPLIEPPFEGLLFLLVRLLVPALDEELNLLLELILAHPSVSQGLICLSLVFMKEPLRHLLESEA